MPNQTHVVLKLDTSRFEAAMRRAAAAASRLSLAFATPAMRHQLRHHHLETPARSAMHTAYDRRRRARRRRPR